MKNLIVLSLVVMLTGCGGSTQFPQVNAHISHPARSLSTTPYVEFMGDDQIAGLVAYAGNPRWKCTTCAQAQLSTTVTTRVPEVIALHPDIVLVQTGAYDEGILTSRTQPTFGDILDILDALEQAGIPAVICSLPKNPVFDVYYLNFGLDDEWEAGLIPHLFTFNDTAENLTGDGVDYSQAGLAEVYPQFYQEVQSFHIGGNQ